MIDMIVLFFILIILIYLIVYSFAKYLAYKKNVLFASIIISLLCSVLFFMVTNFCSVLQPIKICDSDSVALAEDIDLYSGASVLSFIQDQHSKERAALQRLVRRSGIISLELKQGRKETWVTFIKNVAPVWPLPIAEKNIREGFPGFYFTCDLPIISALPHENVRRQIKDFHLGIRIYSVNGVVVNSKVAIRKLLQKFSSADFLSVRYFSSDTYLHTFLLKKMWGPNLMDVLGMNSVAGAPSFVVAPLGHDNFWLAPFYDISGLALRYLGFVPGFTFLELYENWSQIPKQWYLVYSRAFENVSYWFFRIGCIFFALFLSNSSFYLLRLLSARRFLREHCKKYFLDERVAGSCICVMALLWLVKDLFLMRF